MSIILSLAKKSFIIKCQFSELLIFGFVSLYIKTENVEFSSVKHKAIMKFVFWQKKIPKKKSMCKWCKHWVTCTWSYLAVHANIQHRDFQIQNTAWSGRPSMVSTPWWCSWTNFLRFINQSIERITEALEISRRHTGFIIDEQLDMQMLSAKRVSKCLYVNQKWDWIDIAKLILQHFQQSRECLLQWFVTVDEIWLHIIRRPNSNLCSGGNQFIQMACKF